MDQLLVDEFQDTDDVQCRIVRRLALDGAEDQRPGLFVVGDPKQSIYAWRSADLAAYDDFVDESSTAVGDIPADEQLPVRPAHSRRSRALVKPVMHEEHGFQPAFEGLDATDDRIASPGFQHGRWSAVEHWNCRTATRSAIRKPRNRKSTSSMPRKRGRWLPTSGPSTTRPVWPLAMSPYCFERTTAQHFILEAFREFDVPFEVAREREYYPAAGDHRGCGPGAGDPRTRRRPRTADGDPLGCGGRAGRGIGAAVGRRPSRRSCRSGRRRRGRPRPGAAESWPRRPKVAAEPGVDRVPAWPDASTAALERLAELRRSMREDPPGCLCRTAPDPVARRGLGGGSLPRAVSAGTARRFLRRSREAPDRSAGSGAELAASSAGRWRRGGRRRPPRNPIATPMPCT